MPNREYQHTGDWQRWEVPDKVEWVEVDVQGAGSGESRGGRAWGKIRVKGRQALYILVGEAGKEGGHATTGGGGKAGTGPHGTGWAGGGASIIRANSRTGHLLAVAGGAGGASADGGKGGSGGGDVGMAGFLNPDVTDTGDIGMATGGTQIQGGQGGTSSVDSTLDGISAGDDTLSHGGAGGTSTLHLTSGGGGGGGGLHGGGGGVCAYLDQHPGGGGGGGSNYIDGLVGYQNEQGKGNKANGTVTLSWTNPPPRDQPPGPPSQVKVGGTDYNAEMATMSKGKVKVSAVLTDSDSEHGLQMVVYYSPDSSFRQKRVARSDKTDRGKRADVQLEGLAQNTLWYLRLYAKDPQGLMSTNYTSVKFWTNRPPNPPDLTLPGENATIGELDAIVFGWTYSDPDQPEAPHQGGFRLQWRRAGNSIDPAGPWNLVKFDTDDNTYVGAHDDFKSNRTYEWRVAAKDEQGSWGSYSSIRSFFVEGVSAPPWPLSPVNAEALDTSSDLAFTWEFRDPRRNADQRTADLRYRHVDTDDWITIPGDSTDPGPDEALALPGQILPPGHYEWEVRTYSTLRDVPSQWSDAADFWLVDVAPTPDDDLVPVDLTINEVLGCGHNEVHIYLRGGRHYVGPLGATESVYYDRVRDDIGKGIFVTNGTENLDLLRDIHCWTHEAVVFRDTGNGRRQRVFEGPISRITDEPGKFSIEAKDVMGYPYRRIMRQGYNDAYRVVNNTQLGQRTVVQRARQILMNALAPDDPNVLQYLTTLDFYDDAQESRSVPDYSKMSWEEVDDMAATAGLDYTTIGRRIMLWDTHRPIGRLPEMRSAHFSSPPVISEYGMLLATDYAVTNNNGVYAVATRRDPGQVGPYGLVEMLVSAYGETEASGTTDTLTAAEQANLERVLAAQAERGIGSRWPLPLIVRVPDSTTLMPDTPVSLDWLVPGVWVPLRAEGTVRSISQWQKLDKLTVTEDDKGERVGVTFSPAPNHGNDPDAEDPGGDE